jgi:hypothetical protein
MQILNSLAVAYEIGTISIKRIVEPGFDDRYEIYIYGDENIPPCIIKRETLFALSSVLKKYLNFVDL